MKKITLIVLFVFIFAVADIFIGGLSYGKQDIPDTKARIVVVNKKA